MVTSSRDMADNVQQSTSSPVQERLHHENVHETSEQLLIKVGFLEGRLMHVGRSSTDLSCRLLQSEEERLKITKELVEEKLQTNKIREQHEEEMFALKTTILRQTVAIKQLEQQREKPSRELQTAQACQTEREKSDDDTEQKPSTSDKNEQTLTEPHGKEGGRSEELEAEILALTGAQDALRRQLEEQQQSVRSTAQELQQELEAVKALIAHMTRNGVTPEDLTALNEEQKLMEKSLLGNQEEMKDLLHRMQSTSEEQQRKLEEKVAAMGTKHQDGNAGQQSSAGLCCRSQVKEVEEENSKLQLQVKELNEEYRAKLVCYLQDVSDFMDRLGLSESSSVQKTMRSFVDGILQDVRSSYRVREQQLSSAARFYKKRLQRVMTAHHTLRAAYRAQREQILANPACGLDPGPPESHFILEEDKQTELHRLPEDTVRLGASLQASRKEAD